MNSNAKCGGVLGSLRNVLQLNRTGNPWRVQASEWRPSSNGRTLEIVEHDPGPSLTVSKLLYILFKKRDCRSHRDAMGPLCKCDERKAEETLPTNILSPGLFDFVFIFI